MKKTDVLVIGAGINGLSAAWFLNEAGFNVTVADKGDGLNNCSFGNAGMIVPSHIIPLAAPGVISQGLKWMLKPESPFSIRPRLNREFLSWVWKFKQASTQKHVEQSAPVLKDLLLKNRELLVELEEAEQLDFDFQKNGLFMLCNTQKGFEEEAEVAEAIREQELPAEILTSEEVRQQFPKVKLKIKGGVYYPLDAHMHPNTLMVQLRNALIQKGVTFRNQTEVTHIDPSKEDEVRVKTSSGEVLIASKVIVCAGVWSAELGKTISVNIPMQAGKGYSLTLENPPFKTQHCAIFSEARATMTPMGGKLRFAGTMEIVGNKEQINPAKITGLKKSITHFLPDITERHFQGCDPWVGLRPVSPDGLPYIGNIKSHKNIYVSTGHAMMGMSLGLVSGKIIADLIQKGKSDHEHPLIAPDRYN